jgi:hypothetical protein
MRRPTSLLITVNEEQRGLLGCKEAYFDESSMFHRNILPPPSGSNRKSCEKLGGGGGKVSLILKMKALYASKTTRCCSSENRALHSDRRDNLKRKVVVSVNLRLVWRFCNQWVCLTFIKHQYILNQIQQLDRASPVPLAQGNLIQCSEIAFYVAA